MRCEREVRWEHLQNGSLDKRKVVFSEIADDYPDADMNVSVSCQREQSIHFPCEQVQICTMRTRIRLMAKRNKWNQCLECKWSQ